MTPHWHSDPATSAQITYLESLHRKVRGEYEPTNGLTEGEASSMIEEVKGLLLRRDHEFMMREAPQGRRITSPPPDGTYDLDFEHLQPQVSPIRTREMSKHRAREQANRVARERFFRQYGVYTRPEPDESASDRFANPLVVWKAAPGQWLYGDDGIEMLNRGVWKWICYHASHTKPYPRGGSYKGWAGTLERALIHYAKYHGCTDER